MTSPRSLQRKRFDLRAAEDNRRSLRPSSAFALIAAFVALAFLVAVNLQTTAQAARVQTRPCGAAPTEDVDEAPSCAQLRTVVSQLGETNKQLVETNKKLVQAQQEITRLRLQLGAQPSSSVGPTPTASGSSGGTALPSGSSPPGSAGSGSRGSGSQSRASESLAPGRSSSPRPPALPTRPPSTRPPSRPTPVPTVPPGPSPVRPSCVVNIFGICVQVGNSGQ